MSGSVRYDGARALVLGASGFIGRWVAGALERAGARVTAVVRDPAASQSALTMAGVRGWPIELDAADFEELGRLVRDERPDVTFNLIGYGVDRAERDPHIARHINADLPARLADLLSGARSEHGRPGLVHTGSALEYGVAPRVGEDDPAEPTTDYGRTKLDGTRAIEARVGDRLGAVTARLFTVFGPGEHPGRLLPSLLDAAAANAPVELTEGLQKRDFTYVDDVVEGLLRLGLADRPPGVVNLATGELLTVRAFVEIAARELLIPGDHLRFGAREGPREEMSHDPVPIARLREAVGWRPEIAVDEGVARTVAVIDALAEADSEPNGSE